MLATGDKKPSTDTKNQHAAIISHVQQATIAEPAPHPADPVRGSLTVDIFRQLHLSTCGLIVLVGSAGATRHSKARLLQWASGLNWPCLLIGVTGIWMVRERCSESLRRGNDLIYPYGVDNFIMDIDNEARGSDRTLPIAAFQ